MDHSKFNLLLNWKPFVYRLQGKWTFNDTDGVQWPMFFKTKTEAAEMGMRHKEAVLERCGSPA